MNELFVNNLTVVGTNKLFFHVWHECFLTERRFPHCINIWLLLTMYDHISVSFGTSRTTGNRIVLNVWRTTVWGGLVVLLRDQSLLLVIKITFLSLRKLFQQKFLVSAFCVDKDISMDHY